jgi:hypothetical protein
MMSLRSFDINAELEEFMNKYYWEYGEGWIPVRSTLGVLHFLNSHYTKLQPMNVEELEVLTKAFDIVSRFRDRYYPDDATV